MRWINVDNKHKKKYARSFVSCDDAGEMEFLIKTILEEFPWFKPHRVKSAVNYCCLKMEAPRNTKKFLFRVRESVGKV